MTSAGSIRDLTGSGSEDIYVEPDRTSSELLILSSLATPTSRSASGSGPANKLNKPATLPKPATLSVQIPIKIPPLPQGPPPVLGYAAVTAEVSKSRSSTRSEEPRESCLERSDSQCEEDEYESPAVFQEDLKKQKVEVSCYSA